MDGGSYRPRGPRRQGWRCYVRRCTGFRRRERSSIPHNQDTVATATGRFHDRAEAGRLLAERLRKYAGRDDGHRARAATRRGAGGIRALKRSLRRWTCSSCASSASPATRSSRWARSPAAACGSSTGLLVERLGIPADSVEAIETKERRDLERRERDYRGERPPPDLAGRIFRLVDDGSRRIDNARSHLAAAGVFHSDRGRRAGRAAGGLRGPGREAGEIACSVTPAAFGAVGAWYDDFSDRRRRSTRATRALPRRHGSRRSAAGSVGPSLAHPGRGVCDTSTTPPEHRDDRDFAARRRSLETCTLTECRALADDASRAGGEASEAHAHS